MVDDIRDVASRTEDPVTHIKQCVDLVPQGRLEPSCLITHRLKFSDVQFAYDLYSQKSDNVIKVVMEV